MENENNKNTKIIASVLAILIVGSVVGFAVYNSKNDSNVEKKDQKMMENKMEEPFVMVGGSKMVPSKNIVENAANANNVTTVVAAVKAAGLDTTLSGTGPFTVFGPTNAAFDKLPAGTVNELLKPENKEKLTSILTYHVVPGKLKIADLKDGQELMTVNGQKLMVKIMGDKVMINNATIETKDVISSNGVTHVIDTVLIP